MTLIINIRNKQQEKVVKAFLSSLNIGFHSEEEENAALVNAIKKGRKTALLNKVEKASFIRCLKQASKY
ncbi:MAG: hypothetical protein J7621_00190 [Niastella sp.]|nr:hypothetical protein [Niastella sp.]